MSEGVTLSNTPPRLPPRKTASPGPVPLSAPIITEGTSNVASVPPPLPPRSAPLLGKDQPIPLQIPEGSSTPRVDITPATPLQPLSPESPPTSRLIRGEETLRTAPVPTTIHENAIHPPTSAPLPTRSQDTSDQIPIAATNPPDTLVLPNMPHITLPPSEVIIIGALLVNLFFGRLSVTWIATIAGGLYLWKVKGGGSKSQDAFLDPHVRPSEGREAVEWVNHALYALFPLISTDVLTPFIDLLEDALIQQVPPIVTSVRLTSAALGAQPLLLTSLRPMSDQEWFASLTPATRPSERKDQSSSIGSANKQRGHARTTSISKLSRSTSASSFRSELGPEDIAEEATKRRKRDRILHRVSKRRGQGGPSSSSASPDGYGPDFVHRTGEDPAEEAQLPDGDRHRSGPNLEMEQDDPDVGQYVNYQVGFEYRRTETANKKGWGLHMLAYFGWGLKGVGKSEIPVYIDVVHIKGMLNVRLLLSATPPFARTATFSFTKLPEFDISAKPLRQGNFNAMELPGMKTYVQKSIAEVAKAFVRPESYSIDIDRLLLGRESSLRTYTVGVMHIIIHSADDLPKTDTMGSCDPYVMICLTKFRKPVFSTRTIIDTQSPVWEEEAFILITADAIESGERLRLRMVDSDRFSADDSMGVVEVDIPDLVEQAESLSPEQGPLRRIDMLTAERPGMKTSGQLEWSIRFCPGWSMPQEEVKRRTEEKINMRPGEPDASDMILPPWLRWINNYMDIPNWEKERAERRKATLDWFTGDLGREELEASAPPHDELRSGILQFHIHQCVDLEIDSLEGTYSSANNARLSAAGGKPALADEVDRTPVENPDPPSAYCEVHLNDRLVYRTRTKQVTPLPYFNAVSERFLRDWRMAKIVFVVRDERDREHDPILGLVTLYLRDVLKDQCHFTRWFPLSTGLGWGRIRISLLFKPIDIRLPPRISGYEIATLEVKKFEATDLSRMTDRNISVLIETEADRFTLQTAADEDHNSGRPSLEALDSPGTPRSLAESISDTTQVAWELDKPIRLAVQYRHSSSVVISFITRSKVVKKKKVLAIAVVRLDKSPDGELSSFTVPIFETTEVKDAIKGTTEWHRGNSAPSTPNIKRHSSSSSRKSSKSQGARIIGFVSIDLIVHPGISRAHRNLGKKDLRFLKVYEAWESYRDVVTRRAHTRMDKTVWSEDAAAIGGLEDLDESDTSSEDGDSDSENELKRTTSEQELFDEPNKKEGLFAERRAHSKALHKKHKGIFQLKIVRTGQLVKDKIEAKVRSSNKDRRRGADLDVEHEGQSSL